jgi:hypothetical protein
MCIENMSRKRGETAREVAILPRALNGSPITLRWERHGNHGKIMGKPIGKPP